MYIIRCAQSKANHVRPDGGDEVVLCGSAYDVVLTTTSTATG